MFFEGAQFNIIEIPLLIFYIIFFNNDLCIFWFFECIICLFNINGEIQMNKIIKEFGNLIITIFMIFVMEIEYFNFKKIDE